VKPQPAHTAKKIRRVFWMKHLRQWHWISAALCLVGTMLFAVTGLTLNHAADIEAKPQTAERMATLPSELLPGLAAHQGDAGALPPPVIAWIGKTFGVDAAGRTGEWTEEEVYVALPRPGGDAYLTLDRATGEIAYTKTTRGWVSYLNDLHKGRNTGWWWRGFLDVFAVGCVVFTITGLGLLWLHADARKVTWPLVGIGLAIPVLIALLLIH